MNSVSARHSLLRLDGYITQEIDVFAILLVQGELAEQLREVLRNAEVLQMVNDVLLDVLIPLVIGRTRVAILAHHQVRTIALHTHSRVHMHNLQGFVRGGVADKDHLQIDTIAILHTSVLVRGLAHVSAHILENLELQLRIARLLLP